MHSVILDTGFLVALLDKSENNHDRCVTSFKTFKGALLTTEPVLTEAIYLLGPSIKAQKTCIEFILRGVQPSFPNQRKAFQGLLC